MQQRIHQYLRPIFLGASNVNIFMEFLSHYFDCYCVDFRKIVANDIGMYELCVNCDVFVIEKQPAGLNNQHFVPDNLYFDCYNGSKSAAKYPAMFYSHFLSFII